MRKCFKIAFRYDSVDWFEASLKLDVWPNRQNKAWFVSWKVRPLAKALVDPKVTWKCLISYSFPTSQKLVCIYPGILCKYFVVLCRSLQGVAYHQQLINGCCSTFRENLCVCFELWCNLFNYLLRNRKQLHWFLISFIHKANWTGYLGKGVGFIHSIGRYQGLCSQYTG